jgi:dolichol-phosphate mannosyltransferase
MMEIMDQGAEVVYGKRRTRAGETRAKKLTAMVFYRLLDRLIDFHIPADTGDFRLINRRVLEALLSMPESHRFIRGMVSWIGFRQVPIEYDRQSRFAGETHYGFGKMVNFALDAITAFSGKPLRLGVYTGIVFLCLSWIGMLYSLVSWLFSSTVPGWTSLIMIIMFMSGAQIFMLAIMGEYVSRTFIQTKSRPLYLVREIVGETQAGA